MRCRFAEEAALEAQHQVNTLPYTATGGVNGYYYGAEDLTCSGDGACYMGAVEQSDLFNQATWRKSTLSAKGVPIPG
ncbi:MAG: hypothetical protein HRU20_02690 [Pseudomonadales bacterium]|nr:hypothetical protein [Pseudomonadales bacterium]